MLAKALRPGGALAGVPDAVVPREDRRGDRLFAFPSPSSNEASAASNVYFAIINILFAHV